MKNVLLVLSSPRGRQSYSHQFASHIVDDLKARHPGATVVDLRERIDALDDRLEPTRETA